MPSKCRCVSKSRNAIYFSKSLCVIKSRNAIYLYLLVHHARHIMDVDLFVGGVMEPRVYGGVIGETMGCIVARQFSELKFGDAHFFLSKEYPQGFTDRK